MVKLVLYIEGQLVDLFEDESVSLTQTIQNVRDVGKIFTDFTKSFNVPASSRNNQIFKHYYNFDIVGGFDARKKVSATLELNLLPYKKGKIKLEGTKLKNGKISSYQITFFGDTVDIKDKFREDKLNTLNLEAYNLDYTTANIKTKLQVNPTSNDVIAPLITHTQRLIYDSTPSTDVGNLYYTVSTNRGVLWSDLKFALRVDAIVQAIAVRYDMTFSTDFFSSSNKPYYDLFMWMHRKKGSVESPTENQTAQVKFDTWANDSDGDTETVMSSSILTLSGSFYTGLSLDLVTPSGSSYICYVFKNGVQVFSSGEVTGNQSFATEDIDSLEAGNYTVFISSSAGISFTSATWNITRLDGGLITRSKSYASASFTYANSFLFDFSQQIPEIKVIDFLTGIFKMFNLTAYVDQNNGNIIVKTLDSFYSGGTAYDITRFVDISEHEVNVALPYKQINFSYKGLGTFLAENHNQLFNFKWAEENYNGGQDLDGEVYTVEVPFEHMKYEKLQNVLGGTTSIQYGYFVDDNQDSYIGEPLLFYPIRQTGATPISFRDTEVSNSSITTYIIPSNSYSLVSLTSEVNINFKNEINEYQNNTEFKDTLYKVYYSQYIEDVFNSKNRLSKYKLKLPIGFLIKLSLADRFVLYGNRYKINSIDTNLNNGESKVELLIDFSNDVIDITDDPIFGPI